MLSDGQRLAQASSSASRNVVVASGRRPRLDEVLDDEPVRPEQPDPLPVRQLEGDVLAVVDPVHGRSSPGRAGRRPCSAPSGQQIVSIGEWWLNANRPPGRSRRETSGTVRYGSAKVIAPWSQNTMSKRAVRERHGLGARVHEREVDAGLGHQPSSMLELSLERSRPTGRAPARASADRPLRGAAPELQDVLADDVAEHVEVRLRDLARSPGEATPSCRAPPRASPGTRRCRHPTSRGCGRRPP